MVVVQDVRGRYTSEGEWYPFKHETDDGYDTIEWAAASPHTPTGKSACSAAPMSEPRKCSPPSRHPPHLAGICPVVTASNYHENWTYQGGAFEQWFNESWTSGLAQDTLDRTIRRQHQRAEGASWQLPLTQLSAVSILQPATGVPTSTRSVAPYFLDWLAHPTYDDYWKHWSIEEHFADINVPALTSLPGTTFFWADRCATTSASRRTAERGCAQRTASVGDHRRSRRKRPQNRQTSISAQQPRLQ